jgi:hypothetical protein
MSEQEQLTLVEPVKLRLCMPGQGEAEQVVAHSDLENAYQVEGDISTDDPRSILAAEVCSKCVFFVECQNNADLWVAGKKLVYFSGVDPGSMLGGRILRIGGNGERYYDQVLYKEVVEEPTIVAVNRRRSAPALEKIKDEFDPLTALEQIIGHFSDESRSPSGISILDIFEISGLNKVANMTNGRKMDIVKYYLFPMLTEALSELGLRLDIHKVGQTKKYSVSSVPPAKVKLRYVEPPIEEVPVDVSSASGTATAVKVTLPIQEECAPNDVAPKKVKRKPEQKLVTGPEKTKKGEIPLFAYSSETFVAPNKAAELALTSKKASLTRYFTENFEVEKPEELFGQASSLVVYEMFCELHRRAGQQMSATALAEVVRQSLIPIANKNVFEEHFRQELILFFERHGFYGSKVNTEVGKRIQVFTDKARPSKLDAMRLCYIRPFSSRKISG